MRSLKSLHEKRAYGLRSFGAFGKTILQQYLPNPDMRSIGTISGRLSSGDIKTDYVDPVRSTANRKPSQITDPHRKGRPKLLHRHAECEKPALNTTISRRDGPHGPCLQSDPGHEHRWDQAADRCDRSLRQRRPLRTDGLDRPFLRPRSEADIAIRAGVSSHGPVLAGLGGLHAVATGSALPGSQSVSEGP
jgi:hypothetical protein